ncbi:MAG: 2OG-Fe(II) oxygenase [Pleurocapsa sp. CRU_1_2]|nr:2OG-Fe(II) oxygenase [Pleurocapsa sp. CRU_1_2]
MENIITTSTVDSSDLAASSNLLDLTAFTKALDTLRNESDSLRQSYATAKPYPHVVIDDLFQPELLDRLLADFPEPGSRDWLLWDTHNELKSTSRGIEGLSTFTQMFSLWLNSVDVVKTIESIVGINNLVGDPSFHGAGLHEMHRDGWLAMHADYTRHFSMPLMRRINVLIYLNRDWDASWGGELALQDATDENSRVSYPCYFNRTIIFPTTAKTFHGVPTHLSCPPNRSRKLLSIYYWSPIPMPLWSKVGTPLLWASDNKNKLKRLMKGA